MRITVGYGSERLPFEYPEGSVPVDRALRSVGEVQPDVFARWCNKEGDLRSSLGVFVNSEHVRYRQGLQTELSDGDEVYVIPLVTGG
jgi:molybdopterin converting factor small subunit